MRIKIINKMVSLLSIVAIVALAGCETSQDSIANFASEIRPIERQARAAMLAGRHAEADRLYANASKQLDRVSSEAIYVDGLFYVDNARLAGNRALMALLSGEEEKARSHFSASERYLNSGVQAHKSLLSDRAETQEGLATLLGIGAVVGIAAMGVEAHENNPGQSERIVTTQVPRQL